MTNRMLAAAILAAPLLAAPAQAQSPRDCLDVQLPGVESITTFSGRCTRALYRGEDRAADCDAKVTAVGYLNGRSGFTFTLGTGKPVVLTGGNDTREGAVFRLPIDKLTTGLGATDKQPATGTCTIDASDKDATVITCAVVSGGKEARFEFVASGPPTVTRFCPSGK